jgi:8-oxo-dGTP pyrophosphatase MutT (NUDIX family)
MQKVCPVVVRDIDGELGLLSFRHPIAGSQFVKGTVEQGETVVNAAIRELREESGLVATEGRFLGLCLIGSPPVIWNFVLVEVADAMDEWTFRTEDDRGHEFSFFWHPMQEKLSSDWHPDFHEAFAEIRALVGTRST